MSRRSRPGCRTSLGAAFVAAGIVAPPARVEREPAPAKHVNRVAAPDDEPGPRLSTRERLIRAGLIVPHVQEQ